MKSLHDVIKEALLRETKSSIEIEDSGFLLELLDPRGDAKYVKRRMFNFLLLAVTIILCLVAVICSFTFFLNDILLFQNKPKMNYAGAIIPQRSCSREYVLFLFNSADRWAETGIQLQEGDRIKVSASGCFNSDVTAVAHCVKRNERLKHRWVSTTSRDKAGIAQCLYADASAHFGSVLYQINGEMGCDNDTLTHKIHQIDSSSAQHFTKIKENGMLYFSVNDIYLSDTIILYYEALNRRLLHCDSLDSAALTRYNTAQTDPDQVVRLFYHNNNGAVYVAGKQFREYFKENRDAWFNDNIGEILMCVEIERALYVWNWPSKWYRYTERILDGAWSKPWYYALPLTAVYCMWSIVRLVGWILLFGLDVLFKSGMFLVLIVLLIFALRFRSRRKKNVNEGGDSHEV
ncbi:MAG: hypothetical protein RR330_02015 [Alistipes sp.]